MTTDVRRAVASAVQRELRVRGLNASWLAEHSGIPRRALDHKLGMQLDFTVTDLAAIAAALGIPVTHIVPSLPHGGHDRRQSR